VTLSVQVRTTSTRENATVFITSVIISMLATMWTPGVIHALTVTPKGPFYALTVTLKGLFYALTVTPIGCQAAPLLVSRAPPVVIL
jgi:hypothetical protein